MNSEEEPVGDGVTQQQQPVADVEESGSGSGSGSVSDMGGRRRRSSGSRKNSWLSHVKATMKMNRDKSFKQVLKIAKKTYKKSQSQSQSQSAGKGKRKNVKGKRGGNSMKQSIDALLQKQQGGSGMAGKAPFGENAAPVA